jgi:hypothetical protein
VRAVEALRGTGIHGVLAVVPPSAIAVGLVLALVLPVSARVRRSRDAAAFTYPLLLWVVAAASFVPDIANDYSLVFLPLAAVAVLGRGDPPVVWALVAASLAAYQPVAFPIPGAALLVSKVLFLVAVGIVIARRAAAQPALAEALGSGAGAGAGSRE